MSCGRPPIKDNCFIFHVLPHKLFIWAGPIAHFVCPCFKSWLKACSKLTLPIVQVTSHKPINWLKRRHKQIMQCLAFILTNQNYSASWQQAVSTRITQNNVQNLWQTSAHSSPKKHFNLFHIVHVGNFTLTIQPKCAETVKVNPNSTQALRPCIYIFFFKSFRTLKWNLVQGISIFSFLSKRQQERNWWEIDLSHF